LKLSLARLYSDSVYHDRAQEFNDPNFGFSESCTKKNALTKLARMSRVRHNAKSIENRYNSLKILTKCSKHFAHSTKGRHFEKDEFGSSLIFYFVAIQENWRSTIGNPLKLCAETYTRPGTGAPASNKPLELG
jgi:hypothetical protein